MAALFCSAFILQGTWTRLISSGQGGPDLLLCVSIMSVFLHENFKTAAGWTVLLTVIWDLCFSPYPGIGAAAVLLTAGIAFWAKGAFQWEHPVFLAVFTALETFFCSVLTWAGEAALGAPYQLLYIMKYQPVSMVYNAAFAAALYGIFRKGQVQ